MHKTPIPTYYLGKSCKVCYTKSTSYIKIIFWQEMYLSIKSTSDSKFKYIYMFASYTHTTLNVDNPGKLSSPNIQHFYDFLYLYTIGIT